MPVAVLAMSELAALSSASVLLAHVIVAAATSSRGAYTAVAQTQSSAQQ